MTSPPVGEVTDVFFLRKALEQATVRRGFCSPNPSVGAIIVGTTSEIIASGYHFASGSPHAEIAALQKLNMKAGQATAYITLEPCAHWGKTPPCTDALIAAGIKRVVYAHKDLNPLTRGKAEQALTKAGIQVDWLPLPEIEAFYQSYDHWQTTKRPFVTAKIALTLDGKIAGDHGVPIAITGEKIAEWTHYSRLHSDAILTTAQTIKCDDPKLNARYQNQVVAKPLYILDSALALPKQATVLTTAQAITLFYNKDHPDLSSKSALEQMNVRCIGIQGDATGLDLSEVLQIIGQDGIHDLWVEAGGRCFSSLVTANLLQKAYIYIAPRWLGQGQTAFPDHFSLNTAKHFTWRPFDNDVLCEIAW